MDDLRHTSFGELLRTFRTRCRLRQQQLAEKLGLHRNTIGTWERGAYLPQSKGLVLELAAQLHLSEQETRSLLEASLTGLAPHWQVPFPRNPFFTGREEVLAALHAHLGTEQRGPCAQVWALSGLGGVGKTQVALEYAYRYALEYSAVFWIEAETSASIVASVMRIAECLQLPERAAAEQPQIMAAVQRWLNSHSGWLLIWDNLEEIDLFHQILPPARQGAILMTTRRQALGTLALGMELAPMGQQEGMLFVLRRAKVLRPDATSEQMDQLLAGLSGEYAAAHELVQTMGGLPLALDQAGAYIEETGCSFVAYLHRYERQRQQFLSRRGSQRQAIPSRCWRLFSWRVSAWSRMRPQRWSCCASALFCTRMRFLRNCWRWALPTWERFLGWWRLIPSSLMGRLLPCAACRWCSVMPRRRRSPCIAWCRWCCARR